LKTITSNNITKRVYFFVLTDILKGNGITGNVIAVFATLPILTDTLLRPIDVLVSVLNATTSTTPEEFEPIFFTEPLMS
jgi:hypothetical protein